MGARWGAKLLASGMAEAKRRGYGEDGIYFDDQGDDPTAAPASDGSCPGRPG